MFKQTKKPLLLSVLMLVVCLSMLIGTTYAWFTDSVSTGSNVIQVGNLDAVLEYKTNWSDEWASVDENTKIFKEGALYEPGYTEVVYLRVSNAGSLALKYLLSLNLANEKGSINVNGEKFKLSDYLQIGWYVQDEYSDGFNYANILMPVMFGTSESALQKVNLQKLSETKVNICENAPVLPGDKTAQVVAIVLTMPETVGNEANTKFGEETPSIELGVRLFATQLSHEEDSFGNSYDDETAVFTVAKANEMLAANKDVLLVNCIEPNGILYVPANYTGILTLSDVEIASIQQSDAPATISTEATESSSKIEILGDVKVIATEEKMSAITGENINIVGTGTLTAIAKGVAAFGIGGMDTKSININGVKIAYVEGGCAYGVGSDTKYYKDAPEGGAAIGSGYNGATIDLNNVTIIKAIGGSKSAAIGARYHVGVSINITNSTIEYAEGGVSAAAIGSSRVSSGATEAGTTINIEKSTITVKGGAYGAGIGSGYDTHCQAKQPMCVINISESDINAQGGKYAAGVGTGYHNAALNGKIVNSKVNATSGEKYYKDSYTLATGIGFGVVDPAREGQQTDSYIKYNGETINIGNPACFVNGNDALDSAIKGGAETIYLGEGTYIIPDSAQGKTLHFVGTGEDTVIATNTSGSYEGCNYALDGSTVVFENITINTDSKTYTGYARADIVFKNCTINGCITLYGETVFENCEFNIAGDKYNVWTWGAPTATFNNCTFNSDGKALLLYGQANTVLTVNNCTFNDNGGLDDLKAAIEIGNDYNKSYTLYVNNTVVNGYEINDKGINTGTTLWANKNSMPQDKLNVVVDGVDVY